MTSPMTGEWRFTYFVLSGKYLIWNCSEAAEMNIMECTWGKRQHRGWDHDIGKICTLKPSILLVVKHCLSQETSESLQRLSLVDPKHPSASTHQPFHKQMWPSLRNWMPFSYQTQLKFNNGSGKSCLGVAIAEPDLVGFLWVFSHPPSLKTSDKIQLSHFCSKNNAARMIKGSFKQGLASKVLP